MKLIKWDCIVIIVVPASKKRDIMTENLGASKHSV